MQEGERARKSTRSYRNKIFYRLESCFPSFSSSSLTAASVDIKTIAWRKCRMIFLEALSCRSRKLPSKFAHTIFVIILLFYLISLAYKISYFLSAYHYPKLRCVICSDFTLFAPVLHHPLTMATLNCTALSQSD